MADATDRTQPPSRPLLLHASLAGIPLLVDRSWLVGMGVTTACCGAILWLVTPALPVLAAAALGIAMGLALSGSLLLHELAHAVAARHHGVGIDHIRLFAGGALCRRTEPLQAPAEQFTVAAAGPLVSAGLGMVVLVLAICAGVLHAPLPVIAVLWFLGLTNLLVAISNLLPVFPFDGGKLIHAVFWRAGRDRKAASVRLGRSGREFSRVVIALGVLLIAFGGEILIGLVVTAFGVYLLRLPAPQ